MNSKSTTSKTPAEAIGHDYERFCILYARYYKARRPGHTPKFKDETEALIFSSALKKLDAAGISVLGIDERERPVFARRNPPNYGGQK